MSKTHLIIGGSSGIGQKLVKFLAEGGDNVFEGSRRTPEKNSDGKIKHFTYDVTGDDKLPENLDRLDSLAYLPGSINLKPFHKLKREDFLVEYEINVLGAVRAIQQALPLLKKGENPSILCFSTVAVDQGMSFHASTASAKGALEGLVRSLAAELSPGIRVNAIAPSIVKTPLAERLLSTPEKESASASRHPLKTIGDPVEIARMAAMMLTQNTWMTGQILRLDGGMSSIKMI